MSKRTLALVTMMMVCFTFGSQFSPAQAQFVNKPRNTTNKTASNTALEHAKRVATACTPGKWESQPCLKAVSENNLVMLANYGEALQKHKKNESWELLKDNCAASTAATKGEYPAYAMRSAFVECANIIYDITESTRMVPDQSQYQLLVGAVQCLDKTVACNGIEKGLTRYKK